MGGLFSCPQNLTSTNVIIIMPKMSQLKTRKRHNKSAENVTLRYKRIYNGVYKKNWLFKMKNCDKKESEKYTCREGYRCIKR